MTSLNSRNICLHKNCLITKERFFSRLPCCLFSWQNSRNCANLWVNGAIFIMKIQKSILWSQQGKGQCTKATLKNTQQHVHLNRSISNPRWCLMNYVACCFLAHKEKLLKFTFSIFMRHNSPSQRDCVGKGLKSGWILEIDMKQKHEWSDQPGNVIH